MKYTHLAMLGAAVLFSILNPRLSTCFAQGSLTPPGAPAPTMKSLDQIEPRTPISSVATTINQAGSYYLTTNLVGGAGQNGLSISFLANNVVLDLNGFTLSGSVTNSGAGINVASAQGRVVIRNGIITGWGNQGVNAAGVPGCVVEDLIVTGNGRNGISREGILVGDDSRVMRCTSISNSASGIYTGAHSEVTECVASENGNYGISTEIQGLVSRCTGVGNTWQGVSVSDNSLVENCATAYNGLGGIQAFTGCRVTGCTANTNNGVNNVGISVGNMSVISDCIAIGNSTGINSAGGGLISGCVASQNTGYGISLNGAGTMLTGCVSDDNVNDGVLVNYPGCAVVGNLVRGNNVSGTITFAGIRINSAANRIEKNHVSYPANYGIIISGTGSTNNVVICNTTVGNTNFIHSAFPAANDVGPWSKAATATSPWANIYN